MTWSTSRRSIRCWSWPTSSRWTCRPSLSTSCRPRSRRCAALASSCWRKRWKPQSAVRAHPGPWLHAVSGLLAGPTENLSGSRGPAERSAVLHLVARLQDPNLQTRELYDLVRHNASLSHRLLRYINSAAFYLPRRIDSLRQAVVLRGPATDCARLPACCCSTTATRRRWSCCGSRCCVPACASNWPRAQARSGCGLHRWAVLDRRPAVRPAAGRSAGRPAAERRR